jgi:hypothetical protein
MRSLSSWVSDLSFSYTISSASHFFVACFNSVKSLCVQDYTSWFTLTCNLCSALDGILVNTSCICLKSFKGVYPTISSMHNILGLMWNVTCGSNISWTDSHSYFFTLPSICNVDGLIPLLLVVSPSPICLIRCRISSNSSWILSLWHAAWSSSSAR